MEVKIQDLMNAREDIANATKIADRASGRTLQDYTPTQADWSVIENALSGADDLLARMISCAVLRMG